MTGPGAGQASSVTSRTGRAESRAARPWVLHVDLDQFIAAVEVLRHPELRGRPVVVGGDGDPAKRGVVSTASYEAREYGVHSGLPLRTAARRCPDCVFLPVDKEEYEAASAEVMAIAARDTGCDHRGDGLGRGVPGRGRPTTRSRWPGTSPPGSWPATRLHASVGIGQNKLQAKLATGFGKPDGVFRLTHAELVRRAGRPAHRRAVGDRGQDRAAAGRAGHRHGPRTGRWPTRRRWPPSSARRPGRG